MKKYFYLLAAACLVSVAFVGCKKDSQLKDYEIARFSGEPFLGETYISDYDYDAANQFLVDRYREQPNGACSSFRNGDFIGRNQDWYLRNFAMLVVHIAANPEKGRYASVNIVGSNPFVSREMIASGMVPEVVTKEGTTISNWRDIFPIFTLDGINEMGLCANCNIVMHEDQVRTGYVPCTGGTDSLATKTSFLSLMRYILDNCATCQEAIDSCAKLHVTQAFTGLLKTEDNHIFVSDNNESVVLEWYNDHMEYTRFPRSRNFRDEHGMPAIMTNFYNYIARKYTDSEGKINLEDLLSEHPYAMGVERYEILRAGFDHVNSLESAKNLIKQVDYSKFYNKDNRWYTENGSCCVLNGGSWYYPLDANFQNYSRAESLMDALYRMYDDGGVMDDLISSYGNLDRQMRNLDSGVESNNWYTEFSSVYDIPNKKIYIKPQEGWYNNKYYKFTVFGNRK